MKTSIEPMRRQVIEAKLLAALDDKDKAAIIVSKEDLEMLIEAMRLYNWDRKLKKVSEFVDDLKFLHASVF